MRFTRALPLVLALALSACSSPTRSYPEVASLVGSWMTASQPLQPQGGMQQTLYLTDDGHFVARVYDFGLYAGRSARDMSAAITTGGRYRVEGDRIVFQPDSLVTWDSVYQREALVQKPYPYTSYYDDAHFVLDGNRLTLVYLTYPADAPVSTQQTFTRVLPD